MNELESCGLLDRHRQTAGTANRLYIRLPKQDVPDQISADEQYKDPVAGNLTNPQVRNQSPYRSGNSPPDGRSSVHDPGGFVPPRKEKERSDFKDHNDAMTRTAFGVYENIFLTNKEYEVLLSEYPDDLSRYIEELSCHLAATGRTYKNYEAGIRSWAKGDRKKMKEVKQNKYDYSGDDSLCV